MEELQRKKASRKAYRSHLTRLFRKVDAILDSETRPTETQIAILTSSIEQLTERGTLLRELDAQIAATIETENELEAEIIEAEATQEAILDKISQIKRRIDSLHTSPTTHPLSVSTTEFSVPSEPTHRREQPVSRLPKLNLPSFAGDPLTWQGFWDSFEAAVNSNAALDGIQKFNYLKAQLHGDASRAIAGLPLTSANYNHAVALLQERFGQSHKIVNAHMQALLDIPKPTNSLSSLRLFHDSVESHIRGLTALGKSEDSYGALLIPIILGKLPAETRSNLARSHTSLEWTLNELKDSILTEIKILESGLSIQSLEKTSADNSPTMMTASFHMGASANNTPPSSQTKKSACPYCKSLTHPATRCDVVTDQHKRLDIIKKEKRCFNCLAHHKVAQCTSKYRCRGCKGKHHTSLCEKTDDKNSSPPRDKKVDTSNTNNESVTTMTIPVSTQTHSVDKQTSSIHTTTTVCLLKTAIADVRAEGTYCKANILLDEGAQRSFISRKLANCLNIRSNEQQEICLSSFGGATSPVKLQVTSVYLQTRSGDEIPMSVLVVPTIAAPLQHVTYPPASHFPHLQGLTLAHPVMNTKDFEISLLIGADYYWSVVEDTIIRGDGPTAMKSKLGFLLSGPVYPLQTKDQSINVLHTSVATLGDNNVTNFWDLESTGTLPPADSPSDILTSYLKSSVTCQQDGSYKVKFPWKNYHPPLPPNRAICEKRARSLARKLGHTPDLLKTYGEIIADQVKRGFIERVTESEIPHNCHFIPHHPVKKDSTTTPIRIVYDCNCRQSPSHASLNDCLQVGPPFMNDLCSLLLRFRTHKVGLVTDIEKAFLHVYLAEEDQHYTYFLWLSNPDDPESQFIIYRFRVVLFGSVSSPFMLNATLQLILNKDGSTVANDIRQNLYVDNVVSGCNNEDSAVQYFNKARSILSKARFNLRSWASNSQRVMTIARNDNIADNKTIVNVLGIQWNTSQDTLASFPKQFSSVNSTLATKREVLQDVSRIFDPLGFLAPVTIQTKLFMQELWQRKIDWDEPLPTDLRTRWLDIASNLQQTSAFSIPRYCFDSNHSYNEAKQIHIFVDASMKAYGAVAYIRQGKYSSLVMSKTRIAPLKGLTLPRLELMAALIGTRLYKFISSSLALDHNFQMFLWSDSQIVLHWILNQKKLKSFVASRVQEITNSVPTSAWKYCPTQDNPADLVTRGITYRTLETSELWRHGPPWLTSNMQWPKWNRTEVLHLHIATDENEEISDAENPPLQQHSDIQQIINLSNYSNLNTALHVLAYILRFIKNSKQSDESLRQLGSLLPQEINNALQTLIHSCQQTVFSNEFKHLQSKSKQRLPLVRQLRLFIDKSNIIRCGGRIHNAPVKENTKFPILLPKKHPLTSLIILATHKKQLHAGLNCTVTALRQSYWVPSARQIVRQLLTRCVTCRRVMGRPYNIPDPAPLPYIRIKQGKPFEITGVDFTGALYVKTLQGEDKVYICLFTCGLTRAVHLEVVTDLNVETFMQAFRRFVCRKSLPQVMISDNASTYTSAAKELEQLLTATKLNETLSLRGVRWQFIPKRAPWYGGFWERLIGMTKSTIKKVLGRSFITLSTLQTLIVEIEAILNDRPLTYVSSDVTDPEPLTPSHLLYGRRITTLPYRVVEDDEVADPDYTPGPVLREKTKRHTLLLQHFQKRWKREYLTSLRETHRASGTNVQRIRVGDVVLIHDDTPRMTWRLAVVEELIQGMDGLTRAAKIRTKYGRTNRPMAKLYPLEVNEDDGGAISQGTANAGDHENSNIEENTPSDNAAHGRPMRSAARKARNRIKGWTDTLAAAPEDVVK